MLICQKSNVCVLPTLPLYSAHSSLWSGQCVWGPAFLTSSSTLLPPFHTHLSLCGKNTHTTTVFNDWILKIHTFWNFYTSQSIIMLHIMLVQSQRKTFSTKFIFFKKRNDCSDLVGIFYCLGSVFFLSFFFCF